MGYGSTACQHAKIKEMFLTAVTWWEIDTGYRPRDLAHRDLSARLQSKKTPETRLEAPAHIFSFFFFLKRSIFSLLFLQYSCSHVTLTNRVRFPFQFYRRFCLKTEGNDQDDK